MAGVEQAVVEFVKALVHLVLYTRRVYPQETFERRRLFDVVVYRCAQRPEDPDYEHQPSDTMTTSPDP
jgi:hypothetical protein